ncbi:ATP-binding domain-containing protein, partial [Streptococcus suis]
DYGYAATIHKSQGATVDTVHVLASPSMDAHMTYVALSRHRESVNLYAGGDELK